MTSFTKTHGLGWLPDYPDFRDYTEETDEIKIILQPSPLVKSGKPAPASRKSAASKARKLPASVDLRPWCSLTL